MATLETAQPVMSLDLPCVAWTPTSVWPMEPIVTDHSAETGALNMEQDSHQSLKLLVCCTCKKSRCLKRYCVCFQCGKGCGPRCRCVGCENRTDGANKQPSDRVIWGIRLDREKQETEHDLGPERPKRKLEDSGIDEILSSCKQRGVVHKLISALWLQEESKMLESTVRWVFKDAGGGLCKQAGDGLCKQAGGGLCKQAGDDLCK
jgi:hypothetical protein